mmetsp:Transcript_39741/g.118271  ORF Transcript_39741/g.118271 Transcript_39741/m.118271 type:complete len:226 (+) Transcript_39741:152-829(+)
MGAPIRRYYTPYEVAKHNLPDDCWVSFLGGVYDITKLLKDNPGKLIEPLIKAAGKDISHWFNPKTKDLKTHICPVTNLERYYTPMGRFVHVPPAEPMANWDTSFGVPWWKDKAYFIGQLSAKTRVVRIKNVLTEQEDTVEVPSEEAVVEIRERYLDINWHAKSYTWKSLVKQPQGGFAFAELDMNKTLEENGVPDEKAEFEDDHIPQDFYVPVLHVYWNDDLTVA